MSVTSRIADYHGVPTLFVNDQPQVGMAYITYFEENNRYQDFADAGYTLFTFATFFGGQTINETSQIKPFSPGIFDVKGEADYSVFDRSVGQILAVCPQAMIFPRVNMSLPKWWEDEHPDDLNDTGFKGNRRRACFSSKLWRKQSEDFLLQLIDQVEAQPWKDHFVGYQIACGNTEEWFSFDQRGSIGKASRDEFAARGGRSDDAVAYRQFLSQIVAEDIIYLAGVVKKRTNRQLAVGSFYGYTFETPHWMSCHMAVKTILASDDVDFLCSPSSYMNTRSPGQDWPCMTVLDSLLLHGKAYFTELDTRTYLSKFPGQCRANSVVPGTYEQPIWLGPKSPDVSRWLLRANIARQLTHGTNSWWFDMWGGWYATPAMMQEMKNLRAIAVTAMQDGHRESIAQVAVFIDETNYSHFDGSSPLSSQIASLNRRPLGLAGAPYAIYDISDFSAVRNRYHAFVMLAPSMTEAMTEAVSILKAENKPYLLVDENHPSLDTASLRTLYKTANVFVYCDSDDVIYANDHYLAIHAATAGEKRLRLPRRRRITPLLPTGEPLETDSLTVDLQPFETRLFRLD